MSKSALQILARQNAGLIPLNIGTGARPAGVEPLQGLYVLNGQVLAILSSNVVGDVSVANGLPFDVNGRLIVNDAAATHYHQGLPFAALGLFVSGSGDEYFSQGLKFAGGGLGATGLTPPCDPWNNAAPWVNSDPWC